MSLCLALILLAAFPAAGLSQSSDDCLMCHSDKSLTGKRHGRTVPLFVDKATLQKSVHASLGCVDCHAGFNPADLPHAKTIRPVNCQACHEIAAYEKSIHGRAIVTSVGEKALPAASCKDCHGTHQILSPKDPKSLTNRTHLASTCGKCHESEDQHFQLSAHGSALGKGVKGAPTCIDCHGEHNVEETTSRESKVYKTREARVCLSCHLDNPEVRQRMGPSAGFIASYESSVHGVALASGNTNAATCSNCHGAHDMKKASDATSQVNRWNIAQTCSQCHADIARTFNQSIHGTALQAGNKDAPTCTSCHGEHQIYAPADPRSRVSAQNVSAQVCATCHNSVQLSQRYGIPGDRFKTFSDSYHGLASRAGSVEVANCASCHGVHNIKPSSDPASTINKANLATTCGRCHPGANQNFAKGSVHVVMARNGEALLYWIRALYLSLIAGIVGGMFLHNLLDFLKKSRRQLALRQGKLALEHFGSTQYERMSLNERIQHWMMLSSFSVLVITGFMLKFPDAWWVVPIRQLSEKFFEIRSLTHRIAGVVMVAISIYHLWYLFFHPRGKQLLRDMLPKLQDARDSVSLLLYNIGLLKRKPQFGRFGYIEKAEYWALIWGVVVMAATGAVMWFDNYFIGIFTKLGWDVARTIHYYEACLATLAIVVWHFYFVIFNPSVYPINTAWWTGRITEEEMAEEHPLELERIRSEELKRLDSQETKLPVEEPAAKP
ncbi:MAG TPA: cytochrome b/b6 domain-containing protein [Acidobacteriota bacterium]|nr:cytochrome b/b6 domain-containing protein [Acidobacteriota bacterium]